MENQYSIKASCHTYITLSWNGKFVRCYDNDSEYADDIRAKIEKRTGLKLESIKLENGITEFCGFRFISKGFKNFVTGE